MAIIEAKIDESIGNTFDIKLTTKPGYYDFSIFHSLNIGKLLGTGKGGYSGVWALSRPAVIYQRAIKGKKENKDILPSEEIKETLSHELGHAFGLNHPLGDLYKKHENTIMGGPTVTSKFLTQGDLKLLGQGWKDTFKFTQPETSKVNTQIPYNFTRTVFKKILYF